MIDALKTHLDLLAIVGITICSPAYICFILSLFQVLKNRSHIRPPVLRYALRKNISLYYSRDIPPDYILEGIWDEALARAGINDDEATLILLDEDNVAEGYTTIEDSKVVIYARIAPYLIFRGIISHEIEHARQVITGRLHIDPYAKCVMWDGKKMDHIDANAPDNSRYFYLPYEIRAYWNMVTYTPSLSALAVTYAYRYIRAGLKILLLKIKKCGRE